jgi:putative pyoverdin transport system ATP-binding/permease protein
VIATLRFLLGNAYALVSWAVIAGAVSGLTGAALIAILSSASESAHEALKQRQLWLTFLALVAVSVLSKGVSEILLTRLGQRAIADVRVQLSRRVVEAPLRRNEELGAHRVLAALNDDAAVITQAFVYLPMVCVNGATVLGCLGYLAIRAPWALAITVLAMLVGALIFRLHERRANRHFVAARETSDALFQHFRGLTGGIKELKLSRARAEGFLERMLGKSVHNYERDFVSGMSVYTFATGWGTLLFYAVLGTVVFALPGLVGMSASSVTSTTLTLLYLMAPFALLMEILPSVGRASVAVEKWRALGLSLLPEEPSDLQASSLPETWRSIDLVGVTHRYRRERETGTFQLGPVDLTLRRGELVFLVGGNGSGKTSLSLLLLGLYLPEAGQILVDGVQVDDSNRASYRELFSVVFGEYHVFEQLLGLSDPELRERADYYLRRLQLDHRIRIQGETLQVDGLSMGQRKRLALLAAALDDRSFYVFDEWASDQDPESRRFFYTELLPELRARGKGVLVITHDDQYFALADRLLRMDYGQLSESAARALTANSAAEVEA